MREIPKVASLALGAVIVLGCSGGGGAEPDGAPPPPPPDQALPDQVTSPSGCTGELDCAAGLACVEGTCQPCAAHAQCASDVCDRDAATDQGPGACIAEARVVYVEDGAPPACDTADGSRGSPVCQIRDATPLLVSGKDTIRVYPGRYLPFGANGRIMQVFGPGDGSAIAGEEDLGAAFRITNGARVLIDGLDFGVSVRNGVNCDGSQLRFVRGSASGDLSGIIANNCTLTIDRVRADGLTRSGITIAGAGTYAITNSYINGGDIQGVVFSGPSTGTFRFNTVTGSGEISPGGIDCGTTSREIQDSIVFGNFPGVGGAQTVGVCRHQRVVVGAGDTRPDPGLIRIDPELDPQGRLIDNAANAACCIDKGGPVEPGFERDLFGTPRPRGPSTDIGAHELR